MLLALHTESGGGESFLKSCLQYHSQSLPASLAHEFLVEGMRDAIDGKFSLILTKSLSRFARNTVDSLTAIWKLKEHGVEVRFEKENISTFDGKGELLLTIMSSLAQEESRSISENVTWGIRHGFEEGKVSMPYSSFLEYRKGPKGPEVDPEQAEVVRTIYRKFLEGGTTVSIVRELEAAGIPSPTGRSRWHTTTIQSILKKLRVVDLIQRHYSQGG